MPCVSGLIALPIAAAAHPLAMLTEIYIEALLVNEKAADAVWEPWYAGLLSDELAIVYWILISSRVLK